MNNYPELMSIEDVDYEINTDFRYALACFSCINDMELSDYERAYGVIGILFKKMPENENEALKMAIKYLRCGKDEENLYSKTDMDFEFDMHYIRSSFRSDYSIDLNKTSMHWFEFCELLQGLTDNSILNRVRDIRNYDLSTVKDAKTRQKIIQAKQDVALPERLKKEEQDIVDEFYEQLI
ncbi:Gp15 family bacteriophage protein [Oscillospiraceae bacterium WX1]